MDYGDGAFWGYVLCDEDSIFRDWETYVDGALQWWVKVGTMLTCACGGCGVPYYVYIYFLAAEEEGLAIFV